MPYVRIRTNKEISKEKEIEINPETDLVPVCSNCHRMIHRKKNEILSIEELKNILLHI